MDFARRPHILTPSVTSRSGLRILKNEETNESKEIKVTEEVDSTDKSINALAIKAANDATLSYFQQTDISSPYADCTYYQNRTCPTSDIISINSLVVIFESFDNLTFCYATPNEIFHNKNGKFYHDDFIGKPFGSKIRSRTLKGAGYVYVLRPNAELWSRSLNHRTQIVDDVDASMIVYQLHLKPGCIVLESGTGSGSMSHAILRCIAPNGFLHTYEFNNVRVKRAQDEFKKNQVDHLVKVHYRDVCTDGFGVGEHVANAIFLDLPNPWLAIKAASIALVKNGRVCSYSPCIEQTQRTCKALKEHGFHSIKTVEVRLREYYVQDVMLEPPPFTIVNEKRKEKHDISVYKKKNSDDATNDNVKAQETHDGKNLNSNSDIPACNKKRKVVCARPFANMKGHTAFLTFATSGL